MKRKKVILIIDLKNYKEVEYLMSKGVKYGEGGIYATRSRHSGKSWLLCASKRNTQLLYNYRESITVK